MPRVPSRACQGEVQNTEAKMRTPLSGLLARITPATPLSPHTTSCSPNNLPGDTQKRADVCVFLHSVLTQIKSGTRSGSLMLKEWWELNGMMFHTEAFFGMISPSFLNIYRFLHHVQQVFLHTFHVPIQLLYFPSTKKQTL